MNAIDEQLAETEPHRKSRKVRKPFVIEVKFTTNDPMFTWMREWSTHKRYETLQRAEEGLAALRKGAGKGLKDYPILEYRIRDTE